MPLHDWTRVSPGIYHHFHGSWITELGKALNGGLLPSGYYAMTEQIAGEVSQDVLTLQTSQTSSEAPWGGPEGATAVAEAPPKVSIVQELEEIDAYALKRRVLVIRHSSGDRIVALLEILSPGNKNSHRSLAMFVDKAISALWRGYHLLVIDPFPPGSFDPQGIHGAIWGELSSVPYRAPSDRPLTLVAYSAGLTTRAYVEPIAVGGVLPAMPLFLDEGWYVNVPLERTYREAYGGVPERWRRVIEGNEPSSPRSDA
jgi:hypothetical protein